MPDRGTEDHQAGRLLEGRYRIGQRIARGGMAGVYEAVDERLGRTVAVKIMHPGLGDATRDAEESFARRFVREARAAAQLSHPNVVAVHDQGRDPSDGTVYLVMEYVPGHTLRDVVAKEAPMSPERALALLDPVLSALAAAHRAGVVHRDVKPENVLIADDGRVKVADFGLARAVGAETQHTATAGVLIGTVSYLAPELVVEAEADARVDVYAAGVMLYELLTGEKPHDAETPIAVAYRHVHHDVPAPSLRVAGIPDYVDALVARATVRDVTLRPADAGVLLHHVRRVVHALREGLTSDAELVQDLLPGARSGRAGDTTPEPVSSLWAGVDESATTLLRERTELPERTERTAVITPGPPPPRRLDPASADTGRDRRPRRRGRWILALVVVVLLGALGSAGYWFGWGRYTSTPSVVGLEQTAAIAALEDAGLGAQVRERVYSESVEAGQVVATDPAPGDRVLPDATVGLTVSRGPERYDVPDLSGLTLEQATAALEEVKMVVGRRAEAFSETVPEGRVIRSDPAFGSAEAEALPVDTAIGLVVSRGREPIPVRDWTGRDAEQIVKALRAKGLVVEISDRVFSDEVAAGDIVSQQPEPGSDTQLFRGDTVELVVSRGPELVTIPSVRYSSTSSAIDRLEKLGLEVRTERAPIYLTGQVAWDTDPKPGKRVRKGSTVVLFVV
ncbi:Stk1 family PASTA domain-containing Ser/Thr kinase [Nocardioides sp.]|uniref:Stk1 family PASTA domain-containing Ser/Thr kinase n=1 Tax=Nocardioides sp. TaxID=35761 RepID=UPI003513712B